MVEIFAIDSEGGSIGSVGEGVDLESTAPICYISKNKECFLIAESFKHLTNNPQNWKQNMKSYYEIEIFSSKEDAEKKFEFPDSPDIFPKFITVDGWEKLDGNNYMNNKIPGHESG